MRNNQEDETVIPFTMVHRKRMDRTERAVFGYADEGGVFVPGLLQNTADGVNALKVIKKLVYGIVALALFNALHLYGLIDVARAILAGSPK